MEGLGRLFDISAGVAPVDLNTAGATGKRVSLKHAEGVTIVAAFGAQASGTEALAFTLKQHTAATGGTSANLATVTRYYTKLEATLDGDETWSLSTQAAAATIPIVAGDRDKEGILVVEVDGPQLSDGYAYVSLDVADPGAVARLGAVLYILRDLKVQRKPANLAAPLS
jgi:hypothetical protein